MRSSEHGSVLLLPAAAAGRFCRRLFRYLAVLSALFHLALRNTLLPPYNGWSAVRRITVMQIYFTGVQALPLFLFLALLLGLSISTLPGSATELQVLLLNTVLMEGVPIITAFVILGRSGTAVTVELGNMTVLGEIRQLRRMGIDPVRHVVFPRLAGVTLSTLVLSGLFVLSVAGVTVLLSGRPFLTFAQDLVKGWSAAEVGALVLKSAVFGWIIAMVSCYQGLNLVPETTEVPKAVIRTVIHGILLCGTVNALLAYLRFKVTGA